MYCLKSWNERQMSRIVLLLFYLKTRQHSNCCRKTAVCNGDQLLDFSVPELLRSQSMFSTNPEVLQNCAVCWILNCEYRTGYPYVLETSVSVKYFWGSGYRKLSTYIDYLNFQTNSSTFNKKLTQKYQKLLVNCWFHPSYPQSHDSTLLCFTMY